MDFVLSSKHKLATSLSPLFVCVFLSNSLTTAVLALPSTYIYDVCHWKACTDVCVRPKSMAANVLACFSFTRSPRFFVSANHRRAGQAVTTILAKELTQGDEPRSSKPPKKVIKGLRLGSVESLEEFLDAASTLST